jgi:hypothetical protein
MKKHITKEQYDELRKIGYKGGIAIGDLIEFLYENGDLEQIIAKGAAMGESWWEVWLMDGKYKGHYKNYEGHYELIDSLWEAVKGVLEK